MQAVPCGARSDTRLLPATGAQPRSAQMRSVRTYNTRLHVCFNVKTVLTFLGHVWLSRKKRCTGSPRRFRSWPRLGRRGARRPDSPLVHPGARTHGEIRGRNASARFRRMARASYRPFDDPAPWLRVDVRERTRRAVCTRKVNESFQHTARSRSNNRTTTYSQQQ